MESEHIHTGFVAFVTVGVYATLWFWAMHLIAAWLIKHGGETVGKALGATISFGK